MHCQPSSSSSAVEVRTRDQLSHYWKMFTELILTEEPSESAFEMVFYCTRELIFSAARESPTDVNSVDTDDYERNTAGFGPFLSAVCKEDLFGRLLLWVESRPGTENETLLRLHDQQRKHLLALFEYMLTQSRQHILLELPILRPLLQFLFKLSSQLRPAYDQLYAQTLYELCVLLCRDISFLTFCRKVCNELFGQPLLVPLIYRIDIVGDRARDAFLFILSLSKRDDAVGSYLANESDFCPVLAAGLSGLYSNLPKKLVPRYWCTPYNRDAPGGPVTIMPAAFINTTSSTSSPTELPVGGASWYQLTEMDCCQSTDLRRFLETLDLCNLVVKISCPCVQTSLLYYIESGFLVPVLGSALNQSSLYEVVAATAYLELSLRHLTEPKLIKLFLRFIMTSSYDSYPILTSLINRLNASSALGMVTLSLFRTILDFHCEDVMYQLIFNLSEEVRQSSSKEPDDALHLSPYELAPDLVRSGDRLLALATVSTPSERRASHSGFACASTRDSACVESKSGKHFRSDLQRDDWISVNGSFGSLLLQHTHRLHPYIIAAASRIRQHRNACRSWSSMFLSDFFQPDECKCLSDKELLEYELLTLSESQVGHSKQAFFPHQNNTRSHCSSLEECNEPRFSTKTHNQLTSLYQLNYFNDIYDEDSSSNFEKEEPLALAPDSFSNLPVFNSSTPSRGFSPVRMYAELREDEIQLCSCSSHILTSHFNNIFGTSHTTLFPVELDSFLSMLDSIDSPWKCQVHFAHLPSPFSWPPIDPEFIDEINSYFLIPFGRVYSTNDDRSPPEILQISESLSRTLSGRITESPVHSSTKPIAGGIVTVNSLRFWRQSAKPLRIAKSYAVDLETVCCPGYHCWGYGISHGTRYLIAGCLDFTQILVTSFWLGPFLSIVLSRLATLHTNCLFTNLLLTDLLATLAAYPCPMLYTFLLNSIGLQLKSNVNSVFKVLHVVRNQLSARSVSVEQWHSLICRALLYLDVDLPHSTDIPIDPTFYSVSTQRKHSVSSTLISVSQSEYERRLPFNPVCSRPLDDVHTFWLPSGNEDDTRLEELSISSLLNFKHSNSSLLVTQPRTGLPLLLPVNLPELHKKPIMNSPDLPCTSSRPSSHWKPFWNVSVNVYGTPTVDRNRPQITSSMLGASVKRHRSSVFTGPTQAKQEPSILSISSESDDECMHTSKLSIDTRNLVFGAIIFDEFCHELAALCYSHSLSFDLFDVDAAVCKLV
ncbi:hypothetical protein EG68_08314 [Paragonimus skrjabini miyazakii]|uniref:FHF complex subunit HOOK-interacting protein C-terminal domain-containing protein n=1 Tax=Paragonimus skrjabini miyazakii TaxID=59628 RepID=A0A8S9YFE4_9TREM|nr:hypothetical protein EG68_08314 [Paragonimus skrjabini miyazakii]